MPAPPPAHSRVTRVSFRVITAVAFIAPALLALLLMHALPYLSPHQTRRQRSIDSLPRITLWAWERPEFFNGIDKSTAAIAYLDQTIELSFDDHTLPVAVNTRPRLQPVFFPAGGTRIAVVRIEDAQVENVPTYQAPAATSRQTSAAAPDGPAVTETVRLLLKSATRPGIAALQVDFDARKSERPFYRAVLTRLRAQMPTNLPLSITALASWCAYDDWIADLPIDEAVPMFFRMEPGWRGVQSSTALLEDEDYKIREPLCASSIGLSVQGPWPHITNGRRLYLFSDYGWSPSAIQSAIIRTK